jgi:hypothetical protein
MMPVTREKAFYIFILSAFLPFTAYFSFYHHLFFDRFWCSVRAATWYRGRTYVSVGKWDKAVSRP